MGQRSAAELAEALSELLHRNLGARGVGLEARLAHAGRRLPARIRRRAAEIVDAEKRAENPRLARMNDPAALARAFAEVETHLRRIDPAQRRRGAVISLAASLSLALIGAGGGLIAVLVWRGYL